MLVTPTIKDIARETGLSASTISKYLNNKKIHEKNRKKIEKVIEELGYHPNRTAQMLRSGQSKIVAIMVPSLADYFWGDIFTSITRYLSERDYTVTMCSYYGKEETEKEVIQGLIAKNVDGVILSLVNPKDTQYQTLLEANIPVVLFDQKASGVLKFPVDCVYSDNYYSSCKLADYLLKKGHRKIGVICDSNALTAIQERVRCFKETCEAVPGTELLISDSIWFGMEAGEIMKEAQKYFREMLQEKDAPTAIFCTNYIVAIGILMEISAMELSIPDDISIVCYDDDMIFRSMTPPITCVSQDLENMGVQAAKLLIKRMENDWTDFPEEKVISTEFHERASVLVL